MVNFYYLCFYLFLTRGKREKNKMCDPIIGGAILGCCMCVTSAVSEAVSKKESAVSKADTGVVRMGQV